MYKALDISMYIINYSNKKDYGVSNLKLQKLLYFIQAYFLIEKDKPCFVEEIEAWNMGPVVKVVYNKFKQYGSTDIPTIDTYIDYDPTNPWAVSRVKFDKKVIKKKDRKRIKTIVDRFAAHTATDLNNIIFNQRPWRKNIGSIITKEDIIKYFK